MNQELRKKPFVSVVMPVRNEVDFIDRSLKAVLAQNYPPDSMEIIIADGLSTDETRAHIENLKLTTEIPIIIVDNPERIAPSGMNRAIAKSVGEIIVRVDGHCEIEPDYVANCVKYLQDGRAEGVGGPIETLGETLQAQAIAIVMSSTFGVGGSFRVTNVKFLKRSVFLTKNSSAIRTTNLTIVYAKTAAEFCLRPTFARAITVAVISNRCGGNIFNTVTGKSACFSFIRSK
jgi:glycosyltransferase involved in cell wall biosynthesis